MNVANPAEAPDAGLRRFLPLPAVELGNTLGVGRGRRQDRQARRESAGRDGKQRRRARPYDQTPAGKQRSLSVEVPNSPLRPGGKPVFR
jgi:hypothetical protein